MKTSETPGLREALGLLVEPVQKKYQNTKHNLIKTREAVLEIGGLLVLITMAGLDESLEYLATDPTPVSIRNSISIAIGEGGTLGFTRPIKAIQDGWNDFSDAAGLK